MLTSKHFNVTTELACRCCGKADMDQAFVNQLDELREAMGIPLALTSAFRCAAHNAAEGGAKSSQHLLGRAVDISWGNMDGATKQKLLGLAVAKFHGIGLHPMFLHVDARQGAEAVFFYPAGK